MQNGFRVWFTDMEGGLIVLDSWHPDYNSAKIRAHKLVTIIGKSSAGVFKDVYCVDKLIERKEKIIEEEFV